MKYPDRYKDREELIASLAKKVIRELLRVGVKIKNWNGDNGFNRIIIDNDDWHIELNIFVDGYVESDSDDCDTLFTFVEAHSEGSIYLKDGEEEYEIEESLVSNLLYQVDGYIEDRYA